VVFGLLPDEYAANPFSNILSTPVLEIIFL